MMALLIILAEQQVTYSHFENIRMIFDVALRGVLDRAERKKLTSLTNWECMPGVGEAQGKSRAEHFMPD